MTRSVVEKLCTKKVCVDFLASKGGGGLQDGRGRGAARVSAANWGIGGGRGSKYLFSGPKCPSRFTTLFPPFFVHPFFLFFAQSAPRFPTQCSSPKSPLSGTSDLLFLVEKRQLAGAGFWGRFWTGSPHRKKRKLLFSGARKNVSVCDML